MTRLEQEYLHLYRIQKPVIKIIEMNDSNGIPYGWRTKSMLITMKLTDFHREQN